MTALDSLPNPWTNAVQIASETPSSDAWKVIIRIVGSVLKITENYPLEDEWDISLYQEIWTADELVAQWRLSRDQKGFWSRLRRLLRENGIVRIGDLITMEENQIYKIRWIDRIGMRMIRESLASEWLTIWIRLEGIYWETARILGENRRSHPYYWVDHVPYANPLFLEKLESKSSPLNPIELCLLKNSGIVYFWDLVQKSADEIRSIIGVWEKTFQILQDIVHKKWFEFWTVELELWEMIRPKK